ncbi:UNVERIFIED_CONTAM: hypothetical protein HDU68_005324, partial [Siphonaria sp. JEL0065]
HHILRELFRSSKKAKGLEVPKLIKKLKLFQSKLDQTTDDVPETVKESRRKEVRKCERDLALIKTIDLHLLSYNTFLKVLEFNNLPSLSLLSEISAEEHKAILSQFKPDQDDDAHTTTATSSEVVKKEDHAENLVRLSTRIVDHIEFKKTLESGIEELRKILAQNNNALGGVVGEAAIPKPKLSQKERKALNKKRKLEAMQQNNASDGENEDEEDGEGIQAGKYVRAVQSDNEDESMDTETKPQQTKKPNTTTKPSKTTTAATPATTTKPLTKPATQKKIQSAFLETLGGDTLSDVEFSDFSEDDEILSEKKIAEKLKVKKGEAEESKKKKARLGQRARRELWEQQYGKKANHIVNKELSLVNKKKKTAVPAPVDEKLHPSWAAKKAQKIQISDAPVGKKITFGGDDDAAPVFSKKPVAVVEENLHPSWAAKKAQKLQISAAPAGKKIKFGEDDNANASANKPTPSVAPVEENLHPSWAAKKAQKLQISAAPAGKKITFGDDASVPVVAPKPARIQKQPAAAKHTNPSPPPKKQPEPVDEKLHPSWAAKKKQSAAIGNSSGKKIVFGDD